MGMEAPSFRLGDENGELLDSKFLEGMTYVLCAVPDMDEMSQDCLSSMDAIYQKLMVRNIPVLAVVPGSSDELIALREKLGLRIKLLADASLSIYKQVDGKGKPVACIIDRTNSVHDRFEGTTVAENVYQATKSLLK